MKRKTTGFTLVELLVVISIITMLVALLLPALKEARDSARAVTCASNLRQVGMMLNYYSEDFACLPPGNWESPPYPTPGFKWQFYVGFNYDPTLFVTPTGANPAYRTRLVKTDRSSNVYTCPSDDLAINYADTSTGELCVGAGGQGMSYVANSIFFPRHLAPGDKTPIKLDRITRVSERLLLTEKAGNATLNSQSCNLFGPTDGTRMPRISPGWAESPVQLYARHGGNRVYNVLFADFHVNKLPFTTLWSGSTSDYLTTSGKYSILYNVHNPPN